MLICFGHGARGRERTENTPTFAFQNKMKCAIFAFSNLIYQGPEGPSSKHVVYVRSMSVALPIRGLRGDCRRPLHHGIKNIVHRMLNPALGGNIRNFYR